MTVRLKREREDGTWWINVSANRPTTITGMEQVELTRDQLRIIAEALVVQHQLARTDPTRRRQMLIERTLMRIGVPPEDLDALAPE